MIEIKAASKAAAVGSATRKAMRRGEAPDRGSAARAAPERFILLVRPGEDGQYP
jgi:hypothetical protein